MRIMQVSRRVNAREIARQSGRHPHTPLVLLGHAQGAFHESDIASMPIDATESTSLINDAGQAYYMAGYSVVGAGDPIAP